MKPVKLFEDFINEATMGYDFIIKNIEDNDYIVRAMYNGKSVGELRFIKRRSKPFLMAGSLSVDPNHRRKGIASGMYEFAEAELGMKFVRSDDVLTPDGKLLWNNPNRKFGLSEGLVNEKDPAEGTGKKPKGSDRRLYTDENPEDTVPVKFKTAEDIEDTLNQAIFKSKPHARQSQIINLIHQRTRAAHENAKDPEVIKRLGRALEYIEKVKEDSKQKTIELNKKNKS